MPSVELQKVYVTGVGAVTPHALTWAGENGTWERTVKGDIVIQVLDEPWYGREILHNRAKPGFAWHVGRVPEDFHLDKEVMLGKIARRRGRSAQLFAAATFEGMTHAGLEPFLRANEEDDTPDNPLNLEASRRFVTVGMGLGDGANVAEYHERFLHGGPVFEMYAPLIVEPEQAATSQAQKYNFQGAAVGKVSACASGATAIIDGARKIRNGEADIAIVGGVDSFVSFKISPILYHAAGALSTFEDGEDMNPSFASMPYEARRRGFVLAEGAAMMVLESEEHIKKRGAEAKVLAELVGWGETNDASLSDTEPSVRGQALASLQAYRMAGMNPEEVEYINGHGTGTPVGDPNEVASLYVARKNNVKGLYLSGTKSMRGHGIAATGALEAIESVYAIVEGIIPPTPNFEQPMQFPKDLVAQWNLPHSIDDVTISNSAVFRQIQFAQSNSFGFGGNNAVVVFKRFEGF